jgi:transcriptional regulator with XRE-family HTH domain
MATLQETVGGNIRERRLALGLSQQVLAERADISRRMITLIEKGTGNASLGTLDRLAEALQITFASLVEINKGGDKTSADPINLWQGRDRRSQARLLQSCPARQQTELWSWSLAPGERYDAEPDVIGMHEMILVITGQLDLVLAQSSHRLTAGQSISFASDQPYAYINAGTALLRFIKNVVR